MDIPSTSSEDGFFYPLDFDDDLKFVVGVDELFHDVLGGQNPLLPYPGVLDYYSSDNESNGGGEEYSFRNEEVVGVVGQQSSHDLSPCSDKMGRGITSSDLWHSIVKQAHCYVSGKHSSLKSTVHSIREK